jgi:hypothetical protein
MSTPGSVLSGDVAGDYGALGIPPDSDVSRLVSSNPLLQELADAAVDLRRRSPVSTEKLSVFLHSSRQDFWFREERTARSLITC